MRRIGRWIYALVLLAALILGFVFNSENASEVTVTLLGNVLPELRLGIWLLIFTLFGLLLGFALNLIPSMAMRRSLASARRRNEKLEQEVQTLRSQSLRT
ncbi:lipopolysaccharide assembly protein LapA domain-containing protein [Gilvimarinus agarilyticus]|uniref:lipopolysaccharide assembly protein LapA domain-containing protein n=1 Tax=Gilvimarinus agarilyticus TaxID=679259 RepID=UPI0005A1B751|nr:lipopolysaccharide assembly protein LapA domain-containing protein [Gilvimarinus agarilyticus]